MPRAGGPGHDCPRCPRLVAFRKTWREREPDWFNAPVELFGPRDARLLIVGLAPGLRGANRTGRPFTGDYAGDLLYSSLAKFGFARGEYQARPDDGLTLVDCRVTNAVRCVPPENRSHTGGNYDVPQFLAATSPRHRRVSQRCSRSAASPTTRSSWRKVGVGRHIHLLMVAVSMNSAPLTYGGYHCSRLNTNTGVLTPKMFGDVIARIRAQLDAQLLA